MEVEMTAQGLVKPRASGPVVLRSLAISKVKGF